MRRNDSKNLIIGVKHWYAYSETESARLSKLEADSPILIDYIRKYKLAPAPPNKLIVSHPQVDPSMGQARMLMNIFENKKHGFFVECGDYDGEYQSNTILLERKMKWTGVLIEAEPVNFALAMEKRRNVTLIPACLSLTKKPNLSAFNFGRNVYSKINPDSNAPDTVNVQCLPFYSVLLALNRTTIDVFCLDIEGGELDVLKTIPFDKVDIKVLVVEWLLTKEGKQAVVDFMAGKGYISLPSLPAEQIMDRWGHLDCIFIKKGSGLKEIRDWD